MVGPSGDRRLLSVQPCRAVAICIICMYYFSRGKILLFKEISVTKEPGFLESGLGNTGPVTYWLPAVVTSYAFIFSSVKW